MKIGFLRHRVGEDIVGPGERHEEQQLIRVGKMGTGDKDELMDLREVWVGDQKVKDTTN